MRKLLGSLCLGIVAATLPLSAAAATYHVQITNESPYCVRVAGVAVPGNDPAKGVFLNIAADAERLQPGKGLVASYEMPRPAKTVEVQGGPCKPTSPVPRRFAHADKAGRARNVFTIVAGPDKTILVK